MLKLTLTDGNLPLYVSAQALALNGSFWELTKIGSGIYVAGREFWVTETPDQIMAMPEMVKALNPLMMTGYNYPSHTCTSGGQIVPVLDWPR